MAPKSERIPSPPAPESSRRALQAGEVELQRGPAEELRQRGPIAPERGLGERRHLAQETVQRGQRHGALVALQRTGRRELVEDRLLHALQQRHRSREEDVEGTVERRTVRRALDHGAPQDGAERLPVR